MLLLIQLRLDEDSWYSSYTYSRDHVKKLHLPRPKYQNRTAEGANMIQGNDEGSFESHCTGSWSPFLCYPWMSLRFYPGSWWRQLLKPLYNITIKSIVTVIFCVIYTILLEKSQSNSLGQAMHRLLIIQLVFSKICCINEDLHIVSPIE